MPQTRTRRIAAWTAAAAMVLGMAACTPDASHRVELPAQVEGALPDDMQEQLRTATETAMAGTGSTGAVVGVWAPWAGSWVTGLGTTTADGAEVSTDMRFLAGSITKSMTCDVLYALVEEGTVALGDDVTTWLPGMPTLKGITLGQLCDSTSGLASYAGKLQTRWIANPERVWNPRELAAYGMASGLSFEPGSEYGNSDTGYVVLGLALESASNRSAAQLFETYIFEPLGMDASSLPSTSPTDGRLNGLRSGNVDGELSCADTVDLTTFSPSAGYTAGGVVSDVNDIGRYVQALALGLRSYDSDARFEDAVSASRSGSTWYQSKGGALLAGSLAGQFGRVPGYLTSAFADRETGLTVVVVLNNSRASAVAARALSWQLAAIASKAPAVGDLSAPSAGYPWTEADMAESVADEAICE
ncbi:serine hydrolase domain-containing protein [Microbacterium sp. bgisy189]|uniref:serine hydrolase domain-containing protein n=1 Tax=Microbacterium sp. bgisy189 TaxID=3413798 RepID=UPI003EBAA758